MEVQQSRPQRLLHRLPGAQLLRQLLLPLLQILRLLVPLEHPQQFLRTLFPCLGNGVLVSLQTAVQLVFLLLHELVLLLHDGLLERTHLAEHIGLLEFPAVGEAPLQFLPQGANLHLVVVEPVPLKGHLLAQQHDLACEQFAPHFGVEGVVVHVVDALLDVILGSTHVGAVLLELVPGLVQGEAQVRVQELRALLGTEGLEVRATETLVVLFLELEHALLEAFDASVGITLVPICQVGGTHLHAPVTEVEADLAREEPPWGQTVLGLVEQC